MKFRTRYGPWALVAGASEGLGEAFVLAVAERGLNVIMVARRPRVLTAAAERVAARCGVAVLPLAIDLSGADAAAEIAAGVGDREVGLLIYNAAFSQVGAFLDQDLADHLRTLDVNCRTPLGLVHHFGGAMRSRGRGGVLLMGSMTGLQGSPGLATYAGTKAFARVFGESVWGELRASGVDASTCVAGSTRTPGFVAVASGAPGPVMEPRAVADEALGALRHQPSWIPGRRNRLAAWALGKLSRRRQVLILAAAIGAAKRPREG